MNRMNNKKRMNLINRVKNDPTISNELDEQNIPSSKNKNKKKNRKAKYILIFVTIFILIIAIKFGLYVAKWQKLASAMIANTPSTVLDNEKKEIAQIGSSKNIKNINISTIPDNLINAYISIEDQRFYSHSGVDIQRTSSAIFSYIIHFGSSSFGGSTITQQLVKNLTGDNSSSISRKVNEWIRAFALEGIMTKKEILNSYLNIIYIGPNIYGVELGANYYFNKSVDTLSLAECAFLAGINNSPNSYNPFEKENTEEMIIKRTTTVLYKMLELGYISQEDYDNAKNEVNTGLKFKKGDISSSNTSNIYSYHTDALLNEIISDIADKYNISKTFAENYIEMSGLNIYSTQNSSIQNEIEKEFDKNKYKLKSASNSSTLSQAAMVIIDNETGKVLGCVGGIGEKTSRGFNRATQAYRQTGSAGKPLSVLVPAIDKKIITPSTIYVDEATTFDDGSDEGYSPTDYNNYKGEITVREAVESSQNIPFVKIMEQITPKTSIEYMKKMGITSLTEKDENLNLALGGLDKGITPLEMASAYATIANNGKYTEPTFYEEIQLNNGKTLLKSKQKSHTAFSKQVAYIIKNLLIEPVTGSNGTANYCKISNIDVAAKTGTTNNDYDRWLCGFTPYYTAVTWFGFDLNETINFNHKNPAGQIWSNVMTNIHKNLDAQKFELPKNGIETATICPETGLLAYTGCKHAYIEYFLKGTTPIDYCTKHSGSILDKTKQIESLTNTSSSNLDSFIDSFVEDVKEETVDTLKNTISDITSTSTSNTSSNTSSVDKNISTTNTQTNQNTTSTHKNEQLNSNTVSPDNNTTHLESSNNTTPPSTIIEGNKNNDDISNNNEISEDNTFEQ